MSIVVDVVDVVDGEEGGEVAVAAVTVALQNERETRSSDAECAVQKSLPWEPNRNQPGKFVVTTPIKIM
jgi:hypothetical protein